MKAIHDMKRQMQQSVASVLSVRTLLALMLLAVIGAMCLGGAAYADSVGLSRFTDNKDGSMTDTYSSNKLQWKKNANDCSAVNFADATTCVNKLVGGWRVPNIQELYSLCREDGSTEGLDRIIKLGGIWHPCNGRQVSNLVSLFQSAGFTDVQNSFYWSSTSGNDSIMCKDANITCNWGISMNGGNVFPIDIFTSGDGTSFNTYVWPVRDASTPTPTCTYTLDTQGKNFSADGGTGSVKVTTNTGCKWTATSSSDSWSWLQVTSGGSGTGNGTVGYTVAANTGGIPREGTITIEDKKFTVKQEGKATPAQVKLTVTKQGTGNGKVIARGCKMDWVTGMGSCNIGDTIDIQVFEYADSKFAGWGGDCSILLVGKTCTVKMSEAKNVVVTFDKVSASLRQISGYVKYNGNPQSGVNVELWRGDDLIFLERSDPTRNDGAYSFQNISAGSYVLSALSPDKSKIALGFVSITNTNRNLNIDMEPNGKPLIYLPGVMGSVAKGKSLHDGIGTMNVTAKLPKNRCSHPDQLDVLDPRIITGTSYILTPTVDFAGFKAFFEDNKFTVYPVPYDWRLSLDEAACPGGKQPWEYYLKPMIDVVKKVTGYKKVYVVGHSMGGLMTRTYIQSEKYDNDIEKFVMLGTPNKGSANSYFIWEGGDPSLADSLIADFTTDLWSQMYYNATMDNCSIMKGINCYRSPKFKNKSAIKDFIRNDVKGLGNLFPTYDFLKVKGASYTTSAKGYRNSFLNNLNSDGNIARMNETCQIGNSSICVPTALFMTYVEDTIEYINVKRDCSDYAALYEDGCPYDPWSLNPSYESEVFVDKIGDSTVVAKKAKEPFNNSKGLPSIGYYTGDFGTHGTMPANKNLQKLVYSYLIGCGIDPNKPDLCQLIQPTPKDAKRDTVPTTTLGFYLTGGVQPYMTDPQKRTEGLNFTTNEVEENIPDTTLYLGDASSSISINNPINGTYSVDLKGNTGLFTVEAYSLNLSNGSEVKTTKNGFYTNGTFTLSLTLDTNSEVLTITSKIAPPTDVKAQKNSGKARLTWTPSATADVIGYNIYGKTFDQEDFTLLASTGKDITSFDTDNDWASTDTATVWYYVVTAFDADFTESLWDTTAESTNPINADFKASSTTVAVNTPVTFSDLSTGNIVSWQWDFENDGTIDSTSQNPTHTYTAPGTYSVNLYVKDSEGKTDYDSKGVYITVTSATSTGVTRGNKVDLNGDGKADIVWRDTTTGDVAAWLMDGTA
ncbi:secreted protein containing PKD domain protein, partial [Candidatus Magnetobacterium bavaricum]